MFDKNIMDQLIGFIKGISPAEIKNVISLKIEDAKNEMQYLIPETFEDETANIVNDINSKFT